MARKNSKLSGIRKKMLELSIDAYIIPITDPHLGEYVPDHWRIVEWLSGFSGSAANIVITADFAGLWTDSRYFVQAEKQLKNSGFSLQKLKIPHTPEYIGWLGKNMPSGSRVAVDGRIIPIGICRLIEKSFSRKKIKLDLDYDLVSEFWDSRPSIPQGLAFEHELKFAGKSRRDKISELRAGMKSIAADFHLLSSLDDIAWLLNIRGNDVNFSPLLTSFALIGKNEFKLFIDKNKLPFELAQILLAEGINIHPYDSLSKALSNISQAESVLVNPLTTSALLYMSIAEDVIILEDISIPTRQKAVKNDTEIKHIRNVMVKDGVALSKFFFWLEKSINRIDISEISASDRLLEYRMEQEFCTGASFATIAGYNEHAALPHYCSTAETDVLLKPDGIFLLDSGGQYYDGTTDVTRTVCLGRPTRQQRLDFTLALKGTINLALAKFPIGTKGYQIEILARKALWDNGMNYGHGTGHGVGFFLNVHEGPQSIGTGASGDLKTFIEPGMLTADEPAIYREGEYGFRTENLILCVEDEKTEYGQFLKFETVTLCYIDNKLIKTDLLTGEELKWINDYHKEVYEKLSPGLSTEEAEWLKQKTIRLDY